MELMSAGAGGYKTKAYLRLEGRVRAQRWKMMAVLAEPMVIGGVGMVAIGGRALGWW
jgi:hypothetical protein